MIHPEIFNSRRFYVGFPCAVWLTPYVLAAAGYAAWVAGEYGVIERLTVIVLIAAVIVLLVTLRPAYRLQKRLFAWTALLALGAIYFAGEELSWGQWVFGWSAPEHWGEMNDQGETNLHNLAQWGWLLDQLPRLLLTLAAAAGGVLVPLWYLARRMEAPSVTSWSGLLPNIACLPAALIAVLVRPLDTLFESMGDAVPAFLGVGGGELKECMLAVFILMYAGALRAAILRATASGEARS